MAQAAHRREGTARTGPPAPDRLAAERLVASWRRSEDYGVSHDHVEPVFAGTEDHESLFFECGREVLTDLHATLAGEPISLMLTDADGLVLNRLSDDTALLRALDEVHLAPGFAFSEREAGTSGLGLALADRVPTTVRAEQHYNDSLHGYTCAAVPVLDPVTGRLQGAVNLTTWSRSASGLLLALAQSAAGTTTALMLARGAGRASRPAARGSVLHVAAPRLEPGRDTLVRLGPGWTDAVGRAAAALTAGRVVAVVGEAGAGRATLLAQAWRAVHPQHRILSVRPPAATDVERWFGVWSPELGKPHTEVVVCDVDVLPAWSADRLADQVGALAPGGGGGFAVTAQQLGDVAPRLRGLLDVVVEVPPLRERPDDVVPLAAHLAGSSRGREVGLTEAAGRALRSCAWPGNVEQLRRVVVAAAARTDVIDTAHLPAEVLAGSPRALSRVEAFQREEILRALSRPGVTMKQAATELGISRATLYRKVDQFHLTLPR